jgi:hypothetical protein
MLVSGVRATLPDFSVSEAAKLVASDRAHRVVHGDAYYPWNNNKDEKDHDSLLQGFGFTPMTD